MAANIDLGILESAYHTRPPLVRRTNALALAFVAGCLVAGAVPLRTGTAAPGALASSATPSPVPANPTSDRAKALAQTFLTRYNQRDLDGVLAMFIPKVKFGDCDYAHHVEVVLVGKAAVKRWLRTLFEDHDQLEQPEILTGNSQPRTIGIVASRVNDPLKVEGLAPISTGGIKVILNPQRDLIDVWSASGPSCVANRFRPAASVVHTKVVVQQFVDAYNAHDIAGVLDTLSTTVTYGDCDYTRHVLRLFQGKVAVKSWLQARFREHDHFEQAVAEARSGDPQAGGFAASRISDVLRPLEKRGLVPAREGFKIIVDRKGDKIDHTALSGNLRCYAGRGR
jgi:hypothetical protein